MVSEEFVKSVDCLVQSIRPLGYNTQVLQARKLESYEEVT
jgi:hypothetical protein